MSANPTLVIDRIVGTLAGLGDELTAMTNAVNLARDEFTAMQQALRAARFYVDGFEPTHEFEDNDRREMLQLIDELAPPPPLIAPQFCNVDGCCREQGHEGEHDDLPF
jgi:hypothetical protein